MRFFGLYFWIKPEAIINMITPGASYAPTSLANDSIGSPGGVFENGTKLKAISPHPHQDTN